LLTIAVTRVTSDLPQRTYGSTRADFYRPDAFPVVQPTASKHWREYDV